jgi:hypothetical protein
LLGQGAGNLGVGLDQHPVRGDDAALAQTLGLPEAVTGGGQGSIRGWLVVGSKADAERGGDALLASICPDARPPFLVTASGG